MIADVFIKRPVTAIVISVVIVLVGLISMSTLPIAQYPDITPPTVTVPQPLATTEVATLDPAVLAPLAAGAAQALLAEGESPHTVRSYQTALRYWAAWYWLRYGQPIALPLQAASVQQFLVDHLERKTRAGLACELPPALDQALVAGGFKARPGPPAPPRVCAAWESTCS